MMVSIPAVQIPLAAANWPTAVEWRRLSDLCEGIFDCPHTTPMLTASGPYVARSQDVRTGTFRLEQAGHVSEETYLERIDRAEPRHGDLLFSREGTYFGNAAEVPPATKVCLGQRMVLIRPKRSLINPTFLKYWLNSSIMASHVAGLKDGSVAERLNMPTIRALPVPRLDRNRQTQIAAILGALDDKIELNRRTNETLEAMARAMFRDWFVDFGPARAKMEGREPYLAPDVWSLFPDRLDDEGKPEGWKRGTLGEIVAQRVERTDPSDWTISNPYVPIDIISARSLSLFESRSGEEARSSLTRFYRGDFLFGAMRPYFHKVCIAPFDGTTRTTVFVLAPRHSMDYSFSCLLLDDPMTIDYATNHSTGTTIPYATWKGSLEGMPIVKPGREIRQAFHHIVHSILLKLPTTYFENRTLASTRDLLLPKLMSGEIRVGAAEKIAGEAT